MKTSNTTCFIYRFALSSYIFHACSQEIAESKIWSSKGTYKYYEIGVMHVETVLSSLESSILFLL